MVSPPSHRWHGRLTARIAASGLLLTTLATAAGATGGASDRVTFAGSIKEVAPAAVNAPAAAHRAAIVRNTLSPGETAAIREVEVALRMRNFPDLQSRIARGEVIPRAEMEEKYFPAAGDYKKVTDWLKSQGLAVTRTDDNHLAVFASGTVDLVGRVFKVSFARVAVDGVEYSWPSRRRRSRRTLRRRSSESMDFSPT